MAKTTAMKLIELMVLREDIHSVLKYLGEFGDFQFQQDFSKSESSAVNRNREIFQKLQQVRAALNIEDLKSFSGKLELPVTEDYDSAERICAAVDELHAREVDASESLNRDEANYKESLAFSNLKVSYNELEDLSFLTLRFGKIDPEKFDEIKFNAGNRATIMQLGDDKSKILAACSKKARFGMDAVLKEAGFVEIQIPEDFKGIPDDMLESLRQKKEASKKLLDEITEERRNFAETHENTLKKLLQVFCVGSQIFDIENRLESTSYVYRITGWVPAYEVHEITKKIDELTAKRTGVRVYLPSEVPSVVGGHEKVPVQLKHGKIVSNFERVIFSYGAPLYGTVDPTPFVALFFTILFGIMFGDAGQGLVFLILGILCCRKSIKLAGWEKFGYILVSIGISSTIMGVLTGEFFANTTVLRPVARFVTGLFGESRDVILEMMPTSEAESIKRMFMFFGFTVAVGFVINTCGIIINIINQFSLGRHGKAIFGKTGITGAVFFWYVVSFALRIAFFAHVPNILDWIVIGLSLFLTAFGEVFERILEKETPVFENGLFSAVIGAVVEVIEIVSSYLSNSVSFLRVGAFALAHAVLGFIIEMMMEVAPGPAGILVAVVGNGIVICLEGMIVAIQVVRLQYYEFFSKFFTETGREFKPFKLSYKAD